MSRSQRGARSRAIAAEILHDVLRGRRSLDAAMPGRLESVSDPRDAALIKALVYGSLRSRQLHRRLLEQLLKKPLKKKDAVLESLLSVSLFQLLESDRPDFAVVSAAVDATKVLGKPQAKGLINAVLRNFLRRRDELLAAVDDDEEVRFGLPAWLLQRLRRAYPDSWETIAVASNQQAPMWLRVNRQHHTTESYQELLSNAGSAATPAIAAQALRLQSPLPVEQLPGFSAGACSVQDVAAQLAALVLKPQPGERILDACAAPGGKSCHIAELSGNQATVIALDNSAFRMDRVNENAARIGAKLTCVVGDATEPAAWWDGEPFDRILIDAPCSATGVIRRHPDIAYLRRDSDIDELGRLQATILRQLWPLLKPGGVALYATCSVLPDENGAVVASFLNCHEDACLESDATLETVCVPAEGVGYQLLPGNSLDSDGFYFALLKKSAT